MGISSGEEHVVVLLAGIFSYGPGRRG